MFEAAELGHTIDKATYKREVPPLREALLAAQYALLAKADFPVIILISGVDGAGKGETVNVLNEWMDPRHIQTHAFAEPTREEHERPRLWRYWNVLPPKGRIGIFFRSWYSGPISVALHDKKARNSELDQEMERIVRFEKMLADEGALILKFWLHLSKDRQRSRLKALEKDPATRWRISGRDWKNFKIYDRFRKVAEHALRQTSIPEAPWTIVEGADPRYRYMAVGKAILQALQARLALQREGKPAMSAAPVLPKLDQVSVLSRLDLSKKIGKKAYEAELERYQGALNLLTRKAAFANISVICVFEGADAAGKGSTIRRITGALDARYYRVIPTAAPTEEERAQPYLWRFWRHLPRRGHVAIFDRSWYGRVLVERVEGFCSAADWLRAYGEIIDFEEQLVRSRAVVVKFWLQISKDEQLRRFREREQTSFKNFKITADDWRNREKWEDYEVAVCDMIERTSTEIAPWTLVAADNKPYARITVLKTLCQAIEAALAG